MEKLFLEWNFWRVNTGDIGVISQINGKKGVVNNL